MATYLHLINHADDTAKLIDVSGRQSENVEVHRSVMRDNIIHMEKMEPLTIAGKQEIIFESGGLGLMEPHHPLSKGDVAHLIFEREFNNRQQLMIQARLQDTAPEGSDSAIDNFHHQR